MDQPSSPDILIRHDLRAGDAEAVVDFHRRVYADEYGFDESFAAHVAGPFDVFVRTHTDRDRLWLAERDGRLVGCIAIVEASPTQAQLRWYLVDPSERGAGLGTRLLNAALAFTRECGYDTVFLWTVSALTAAARLYRSVGFVKTEALPSRPWGVDVVEERYEMRLGKPGAS